MPVRLIGTIILLLIVTIFAGANLDNRCNINFIFRTVQNVPVFLTAVVSFLAGAIIMIPFTFRCRKNKKENPEKKVAEQKNKDEESKTLFDFKIKKGMDKKHKKEKNPSFKKSEENEGNSENKDEIPENKESGTDSSGTQEKDGASTKSETSL